MQYWVLYYAGVGGDGFANLLEHAQGFVNFDPESPEWRIDRVINGRVKFHASHWAKAVSGIRDGRPYVVYPFRTTYPTSSELEPWYVDAVERNDNIVIPVHCKDYWRDIEQYVNKDVVKKQQVLIHLYSSDAERVVKDKIVKNRVVPTTIKTEIAAYNDNLRRNLARKEYSLHIDIDRAWRKWPYLRDTLATIGIKLDKKYYDTYMKFMGTKLPNDPLLDELRKTNIPIIYDLDLDSYAPISPL